jgi:4-carboxymuconolactone decarboxylase
MNDTTTARGLAVFGELLGDQAKAAMAAGLEADGFGAALGKLACDFAFAGVWGREGLERKQRSLVTIGVLIGQGQSDELKNHIRIGLRNGLTPREIEEAMLQTLPYVGFPKVASAATAIVEVLREQGIDTTATTAQERGLL